MLAAKHSLFAVICSDAGAFCFEVGVIYSEFDENFPNAGAFCSNVGVICSAIDENFPNAGAFCSTIAVICSAFAAFYSKSEEFIPNTRPFHTS